MKKKVLIFALIALAFLGNSCEKTEIQAVQEDLSLQDQMSSRKAQGDNGNLPQWISRGACLDNLTDNGCEFTSGEGLDFPNQYLMVDMLNDCHTEPLASNCAWQGNITQTRNIQVDLSNCCFPFYALNFHVDSWMQLAQASRPGSGYLITNYQRLSGFMVTSAGPYRMTIKVTYRRSICSIPIRIER